VTPPILANHDERVTCMSNDAFDEDYRRRTRDQIARIIEHRQGAVGWDSADEADFSFLFDPRYILLRPGTNPDEVGDVLDKSGEFDGRGGVVGAVRPDDGTRKTRRPRRSARTADADVPRVTRYGLPGRTDTGEPDALRALDLLDDALGVGATTPEHLVHVTGNASCCPAVEPAETGLGDPWPGQTGDRGAGKGVRILVIDSGLHPPSTTDGRTPWLKGVNGDDEGNGPVLTTYAGHGTFAAGVIRCRAPRARVQVRRFFDASGVASEVELQAQLETALRARQPPDIISVSAGTYTRKSLPLLSFELLRENVLSQLPNTVLVAAAGNDSRYAPFWPAAFEWALGVGSLDRDGAISSYSNFGPSADVFALGRNHVNAFPDGLFVCHETPDRGDERRFGTGLARWSGTSFSTPLVAGLIAAEMSRNGLLGAPGTARDNLLNNAGTPGWDPVRGPFVALPTP
jgi:Subtilase family